MRIISELARHAAGDVPDVLVGVVPEAVEGSLLVRALVGVGSEEVALSLWKQESIERTMNPLSQQASLETRANEACNWKQKHPHPVIASNACAKNTLRQIPWRGQLRSDWLRTTVSCHRHRHRIQRRHQKIAHKTPWHGRAYLNKVGWQASAAVGVEVGERRGHGRGSDAACYAERHHTPPGRLALQDLSREERVDKQVVEIFVLDVGVLNVVKEGSADDAAPLPDAGALSEVDAPLEVLGCALDEVHAL